jgi:hypothetical protein
MAIISSVGPDEWVEVANPGPGELDLAGYYLADAAGGRVYGFTGMLAAGAVTVVYGSAAATWEAANGESTTGLRLGNDGGIVQLLQVVGGAPIVVDTVSYLNHEAEDDRSSGRLPDGSSTWVLFDSLFPYTGTLTPAGTGMPPTPGARNDGSPVDPPPTPSQETTWGAVKALYSLS